MNIHELQMGGASEVSITEGDVNLQNTGLTVNLS
jgi:hypothetical protein